MSRRTNGRIAGFAFLFSIAAVALPASRAQRIATPPPGSDPAGVAFGYTDSTGSKLLTLAEHNGPIDPAQPENLVSAVCSEGRVVSIRYAQRQKSTPASNGRQSAGNFANDEGQLFDIVGAHAEPDDTCLLIPAGYLQAFPVARNDVPKTERDTWHGQALPPRTAFATQGLRRIEQEKGRAAKIYWPLHRMGGTSEVAVVEFEAKGDSLLGSLVLIDPASLSFFDMPASLREGRERGGCWRVDDDCRFDYLDMDVPAVLGAAGRRLVFFTSRGPEGQLMVLLQAKDGKLVELRRASRYQSPV